MDALEILGWALIAGLAVCASLLPIYILDDIFGGDKK